MNPTALHFCLLRFPETREMFKWRSIKAGARMAARLFEVVEPANLDSSVVRCSRKTSQRYVPVIVEMSGFS